MQNAKKAAQQRTFAREASVMLEVEGERAKRRQGTRTDLLLNIPQNSTESAGEARKIVAEKLGVVERLKRNQQRAGGDRKSSAYQNGSLVPNSAQAIKKNGEASESCGPEYSRYCYSLWRKPDDYTEIQGAIYGISIDGVEELSSNFFTHTFKCQT